jgi:hypothetical protein
VRFLQAALPVTETVPFIMTSLFSPGMACPIQVRVSLQSPPVGTEEMVAAVADDPRSAARNKKRRFMETPLWLKMANEDDYFMQKYTTKRSQNQINFINVLIYLGRRRKADYSLAVQSEKSMLFGTYGDKSVRLRQSRQVSR